MIFKLVINLLKALVQRFPTFCAHAPLNMKIETYVPRERFLKVNLARNCRRLKFCAPLEISHIPPVGNRCSNTYKSFFNLSSPYSYPPPTFHKMFRQNFFTLMLTHFSTWQMSKHCTKLKIASEDFFEINLCTGGSCYPWVCYPRMANINRDFVSRLSSKLKSIQSFHAKMHIQTALVIYGQKKCE